MKGDLTLRKGVWRASAVAVVAGAALLVPMSTAYAARGSGVTHHGYSNITGTAPLSTDPNEPLCLFVSDANNRTQVVLYNTGTFNGGTTFQSFKATFTATESYYFGPGGTYLNSSCSGTTDQIEGTLSLTGGVHCNDTDATYERIAATYTISTADSITCSINPGGSSVTSSDLTFTGIQLACDASTNNCGEGANSIEFTGNYSQT
jgi:hypothetical protein